MVMRSTNKNNIMTTIEERLRNEYPDGKLTVVPVDEDGPYKVYDVVIRKRVMAHNPNYPDDNRCLCGHAYYRHFDPYENWEAVGCKHCSCGHFVHEEGADRMSPFSRMQNFGQWHVQWEDYLLQWEMFGHAYYPTLQDYLGASLKEWTDITNPPPMASTPCTLSGMRYGNTSYADDDDFVEVVE